MSEQLDADSSKPSDPPVAPDGQVPQHAPTGPPTRRDLATGTRRPRCRIPPGPTSPRSPPGGGRPSGPVRGTGARYPYSQHAHPVERHRLSVSRSSASPWLTGETAGGPWSWHQAPVAGATAVLYVREYAGPGEPAYFASRSYGAVWVGNVPSVADTNTALGVTTRGRREVSRGLEAHRGREIALVRGFDTPAWTSNYPRPAARHSPRSSMNCGWSRTNGRSSGCGSVRATARGFADVARELPKVLDRPDIRGERWLEGTFWRRARLEGNEVGYGDHRRRPRHDGPALVAQSRRDRSGQLLLADMGVETDELYTADVTRTMPVTGEWTPRSAARLPGGTRSSGRRHRRGQSGRRFLAAHRAAMWVLADHLHQWGILDVPAESPARDPEATRCRVAPPLHIARHVAHARHRCARLRAGRERGLPRRGLAAGYVLTVEPGLYFQRQRSGVPPSCAASACASRTTSWSPTAGDQPVDGLAPRTPTTSSRGCARFRRRRPLPKVKADRHTGRGRRLPDGLVIPGPELLGSAARLGQVGNR